MNNDIYNNKSGSSLQDAYARLNEAIKIRDANAKGQQYDKNNGVALNTTPISNNVNQGQLQSRWAQECCQERKPSVYVPSYRFCPAQTMPPRFAK